MAFHPKVSIIVPVYNGSNYMREAIDSALAQTYSNTEVIVVNDGSNDQGKTEAIAKSYGTKIRYVCKENGGVATALNMGIQEMEGEYFSWLSHDDVYYPWKLERQIAFLQTNRKDIVLYSDYDFIDRNSQFIRTSKIHHVEPEQFIYALLTSYPIHGCTALVPRQCFLDVGMFEKKLKTTQDYDLWFRMAQKYRFIHIGEVLIQSRLHPEQGTQTMGETVMREINDFYIHCLNMVNAMNEPLLPHESKKLINIKCALKWRERGFIKASEHAYSLYLNRMFPPEKHFDFKYYYYVFQYHYQISKIKSLIDLLPHYPKSLLRKK